MMMYALRTGAALLETEIDHGVIQVGGNATIRVKVSGDTTDIKPIQYPSVQGLKIEYAGMQRSFQFINGKSWSGVELIFTVTALKAGKFKIPGFVFKRGKETMQSRDVTLVVSTEKSGVSSISMDIKPVVELSTARTYVGQPVVMRYCILSSGITATLRGFENIPNTKGFVIKKIDDADSSLLQSQQAEYEKTQVSTFALIPTESGIYRVGGGTAVFSVDTPLRRSRDEDFFGFNFPAFTQTKNLNFETRPITVLPLPRQGAPADFRGDIGVFSIRADYADDSVKVYEEKKVTVTVEGRGNLVTMTRPMLENGSEGLKIISEDGDSSVRIEGSEVTGSRKFIYTLIPEKVGTRDAGSFKFSFFNTKTGVYETIRTKNISFVAMRDESKTGEAFDKEAEDRLSFNPLYFLFIVLALAGIIVFVVIWERKRFEMASVGEAGALKEQSIEHGPDDHNLRMDLARCTESGDGDLFLKVADKYLDQVLRACAGSVPGEIEKAVRNIKGEIYQYKFGGGKIAPDDLKRMYDEIAALKAD